MKNTVAHNLIIVLAVSMLGFSNDRKISKHPMLEPVPATLADPLKMDESLRAASPERNNRIRKILEENHIVMPADLIFKCESQEPQIDFLNSEKQGHVTWITYALGCDIAGDDVSIMFNYWIYEDPPKAVIGTRKRLSGGPGVFYEDQVGRTFTGKSFGDFIVHMGDESTGGISAYMLCKNYLIHYSIDSVERRRLQTNILDELSEAIVRKIDK